MKSLFSYIILFCFSLVSMVSCVSKKPSEPVIVTKTKTVKEIVKDTVFEVKADSSFYQAYIDCRDGQPILIDKPFPTLNKTEVKEAYKGSYVNAPKVNLSKNGVLNISCEAEAQKLFAKWKNTYIHEQEPVIVEVPKETFIEKPYPWHVKIPLWLGRLILVVFAVVMLIELYKLIKKK